MDGWMAAALIKQVYIARLEMDIYFETTAKGGSYGYWYTHAQVNVLVTWYTYLST